MINKNKLKKILFLTILLSSTFSINTINVKAAGPNLQHNSTTNPTSPGTFNSPTSNTGGGGTPTYGSSCDNAYCGISRSYSINQELNFAIKNHKGELIAENAFDPKLLTEKFLAGTYIMLKISENSSFISTASYTVSAHRQEWFCEYIDIQEYACGVDDEGNTLYCQNRVLISSGVEECSCHGSADIINHMFNGWKDVTSEYIGQCAAAAQPIQITLGPSYDAYYEDSNDIDTENKYNNQSDYIDTSGIVEGTSCSEPVKGVVPPTTGAEGYKSGNTLSGSCSSSYNRTETICMNVKTAKVRYTGGKCNENGYTDEYEITQDEDGFFKYFIPLNTSSTDPFTVVLKTKSNATKVHSGICEDAINKYDYYPYFLVDSNKQSFIGQNLTKEEAKERVKDGCYFQTTAAIPIEQKFYNEIENGRFKGFNFYYRPIDINNAFPNGLTDTSIWYDWYKSDYKEPDLTESFNKTTYFADIAGNEIKIRKYNNEENGDGENINPYTSWDNINIDGVSNYIETQGIIHRYVDRDSFYKLGCGPENSTTDVNNVFYQQECVRK